MLLSYYEKVLILPIDKSNYSISDGRFIIDTQLLPHACTRCGSNGIKEQIIRIKIPYDWKFWLPIVAFLGGPLLFGIGSAVAYFFFGDDGLREYSSYGILIATLISILGGFRMATSNKENWFLTFYFCQDCTNLYSSLQSKSRYYLWGCFASILIMLVIAILNSTLHLTQDTIQLIMWILLITSLGMFVCYIICYIKKIIFRGIIAQWIKGGDSIRIKLKNVSAANIYKTKLH